MKSHRSRPERATTRKAAPSHPWVSLLGALSSISACISAGGTPHTDLSGATSASLQARYPRRPAGCEVLLFYTAVPPVRAWDDLGVAEAGCHINDSVAECLRRLKGEACRMGGDILYNVPRRPLRPRDQVVLYRAQVAHTQLGAPKKDEDDEAELPPPASAEELARPVVPLPSGERARSGRAPEASPEPNADALTAPPAPSGSTAPRTPVVAPGDER